VDLAIRFLIGMLLAIGVSLAWLLKRSTIKPAGV